MDSQLKTNIKNDINIFCKKLLGYSDDRFINSPFIIIVYLGKESYENVNAPLIGAFTSSFYHEPTLCEICIDDYMAKDVIVQNMSNAISEMSMQGKSYDDIRIIFVGLMHDPFFNESHLREVNEIKQALNDMRNYGLLLNKIAFYGIFNQRYINNMNYKYAFEFIDQGKDIWNNVYHYEVRFTLNDYNQATQLIALHTIANTYSMVQNNDHEYHWQSLSLHYLRIPEFFTTMLLYEIYNRQLDSSRIDINSWKESITEILDKYYKQLFYTDFKDCYRYVPLHLQMAEKKSKKNIFSFFNHEEEVPVYHNILLDNNEISDLCQSLYSDIALKPQQYQQILKEILYSSTALSNDIDSIRNILIDILNREKEDYSYQLQNYKIIKDENIDDVDKYLRDKFNIECLKTILNKKIDMMTQLIEVIDQSHLLNDYIHEIVHQNNDYTRILNELCINEYGGIMNGLSINDVPVFTINKPINELLEEIDYKLVNNLINDQVTIYDKLETFLFKTLNTSTNMSHVLGEINGEYNIIEPVKYLFLMPPGMANDSKYNTIIGKYTYLMKDIQPIYRKNSFFIISSRDYYSDRYIIRYKRG